jgi:ATP-binding cassette subfamily B protein
MQIVSRFIVYYRRYWFVVAAAYTCLLTATMIDLYIPSLIRQVIDCGIQSGVGDRIRAGCTPGIDPAALAWHVSAMIIGLTIIKGGFQFGQGFLGEYSAQGIAYDIRNQMYRHFQRLSFSWHDRAQTGQLMARATSDVEQLRNFTGRAVLQLANLVFMGTGIAIVLFATNWELAIAALITVPLLIRVIDQYNRNVRPLFREAQEELAQLAAIIQENLAGGKVVRAFAREPDEIAKFDRQNARLQYQYVAAAEVSSVANPLMDVIANVGTVLVLWFGGYLIIRGELTVGQLVAFNTYLLLIVRPIRRLGFLIGQSSRALAAGERIFEILDAPVEVHDKSDAVPLPPIAGHVVLDHVWISYSGGEPALRDVTIEAKPGQVVALLGATGSGKTSVVNLIPRFYDVTQGQVLIDGYDVRDVQLETLRRQIGIVLQDNMLFSGTIRENIAFGVPDADEERVLAAARAARAHNFITEFPRGYNTRVGERGVTLSGGQKQRIAIARALLLDPRILILDDFTSAVDTETEALIREALEVLMEGRTTLVIAQRVSTVQSADQIIVLERGQVVGIGTHDELLQTNEIYSEIYRLQLMDESVPAELRPEPALAGASTSLLGGMYSNGNGHGAPDGARPRRNGRMNGRGGGYGGRPVNGNGHAQTRDNEETVGGRSS